MSTRIRPSRRAARTLFVLFAVSLGVFAADRPEPPRLVEEIVAKINGDIITRGELVKSRAALEREIRQQAQERPQPGAAVEAVIEQAARDDLRNQIDQLLLVQKGKELDINVDPDLTRYIAA